MKLPKLKINDPNRFAFVNTTGGYPAAVPISSITEVTGTFYTKIRVDPFRPVHISKSISTISPIAIEKRRDFQLQQKTPKKTEEQLYPSYQSLQKSKTKNQKKNGVESIEESFMINGIKTSTNTIEDALYIPSTYIRKNVSDLTPITHKPVDNHSKIDLLPSLPSCTHDIRSNPYLKEKEELQNRKYKCGGKK